MSHPHVDLGAPDPRWCSDHPYLGFDGKPHRHRMGLRPLDLDAWLEPDANASAQLDLKQALLRDRRDEVLYDDGSATAARAARVLESLVASAQGRATIDAFTAGESLAATSLTTQEDWCLMVREDTWRLRAACVCFPSRWVLADKHGGTIAEIHGPVPRYEDQLGGLVERSMDRMVPERAVWRLNWNIWEDPRLHQPTEDPDGHRWPMPTVEELATRAVLRVERQTLRKIAPDAVAFSIRVHQRPLGALRHQEGALELLAATLEGLDDSPVGRKKLGRLDGLLQAWVAQELGR